MGRARIIATAVLGVAAATLGTPASAQLFLYDPQIPSGPMAPDDPLVGIPLPGATPAEAQAGMIWNLRSGLNVAALQCQFSPFLRTVDNYNGIITGQHARELQAAYTALEGYFRRTAGRNGPRRFDDYSTQTYNNFSTLQAQLGFCQTAAKIGRVALAARAGELHNVAAAYMRELRGSLTPAHDSYLFTRMPIALAPIDLSLDCTSLRDRRVYAA